MTTVTPPTIPTLQHVLSIEFETSRSISEGHPEGDRILMRVQGGSFQGDGPAGRFGGSVGHGGDWVTRRADGSVTLDVRAELHAEDGTIVLMTYTGVSASGAVRTSPRFSAPSASSLGWLNDLVCIAEGTVGQNSVVYHVWTLA